MGFIDEDKRLAINEEHKIRITLSNSALHTMANDMEIFKVPKAATFINTVFNNFKFEAKSSISLYLQQREIDLDRMFTSAKLDEASKKIAIKCILSTEKQEIENKIKEYLSAKGESKLYHINKNNADYLKNDCDEEQYYKCHPSLYIRSVVEEYCSLPFIERERIYKKEIYDIIEQACREKKVLKITATTYKGKEQDFLVYPYKIVPDFLHTQSYLVCYSYAVNEPKEDKIIGSFSMKSINTLKMRCEKFNLNKQEINNIEYQISKYSPAYLTSQSKQKNQTEKIKVRLTQNGKLSYQAKLYPRPEKINSLSSDDVYVFDCAEQQIFNYFFPFGAEAEILSPVDLRNRFKTIHENALKNYKE